MSSIISERFGKELSKFFSWAESNDYLVSNGKKTWGMALAYKFDEPGRNKLDMFIKHVLKTHSVTVSDENITDHRDIIKAYKEGKANKTNKDNTDNKANSKGKASAKKVQSKDKVCYDIIKNNKLDTSETYYVETLEFSAHQLEQAFGKPIKSGNTDTKHRYEWIIKLTIEGEARVYSIYDWVIDEDNKLFDEYEDCEWYLAGCDEIQLSTFKKYKKIRKKLTTKLTMKKLTMKKLRMKIFLEMKKTKILIWKNKILTAKQPKNIKI
jgi:hypothetical protein